MKLHINKIHDTHSVRSQLLRIFLLAGMFPLLVIGIFSIASVRKQMLARYESLEKADGLRVASSLNDITTTVYSSSDTLLNSNQCLSLFAAESLDSGIEEQLTALERALQTYFENTAAVARIQIYTNNPNLQNSEHIHYQQNFVLDEWRKTLGNNWSTWASLQRYTAIVRQPYRELTLIRRMLPPVNIRHFWLSVWTAIPLKIIWSSPAMKQPSVWTEPRSSMPQTLF